MLSGAASITIAVEFAKYISDLPAFEEFEGINICREKPYLETLKIRKCAGSNDIFLIQKKARWDIFC